MKISYQYNFLGISCSISGFSYFSGTGKCYKYSSREGSQGDASKACKSGGADLATILDKPTNDFVQKLVKSTAWIGGGYLPPGSPTISSGWYWASLFDINNTDRFLNDVFFYYLINSIF